MHNSGKKKKVETEVIHIALTMGRVGLDNKVKKITSKLAWTEYNYIFYAVLSGRHPF